MESTFEIKQLNLSIIWHQNLFTWKQDWGDGIPQMEQIWMWFS